MRDFTIQTYNSLISTLKKQGFEFLQYKDFHNNNDSHKQIILRHDVDARKENSMHFAKIQNKMDIVGTYYFRIVPQSFDEKIIKDIYSLGHEIGYHYETMDTCRGNLDKAYDEFCRNLEMLRKLVPVLTVCMHGSPTSKYDNRSIWKKYNYRELGIIAEPYFDIVFDNVLYLTDTGRRWNGDAFRIRDKGLWGDFKKWKVEPIQGGLMNMTPESLDFQNKYKFSSTYDIIRAAEKGELPDKIMMTFHPQRWTDKPLPWLKELVWQNVKNVGKYFLIKLRE